MRKNCPADTGRVGGVRGRRNFKCSERILTGTEAIMSVVTIRINAIKIMG